MGEGRGYSESEVLLRRNPSLPRKVAGGSHIAPEQHPDERVTDSPEKE